VLAWAVLVIIVAAIVFWLATAIVDEDDGL
jgi:hypothetical protein